MNRYVVVTTISTFRHRYVIPEDALRIEGSLSDEDVLIGAKDFVTMEEVKEFSQDHLGETIIDASIMDEKDALILMDRDNQYLSSWSVENKIDFMKSWTEEMDLERVRRFHETSNNQERYHNYIIRMEKELRENINE